MHPFICKICAFTPLNLNLSYLDCHSKHAAHYVHVGSVLMIRFSIEIVHSYIVAIDELLYTLILCIHYKQELIERGTLLITIPTPLSSLTVEPLCLSRRAHVWWPCSRQWPPLAIYTILLHFNEFVMQDEEYVFLPV